MTSLRAREGVFGSLCCDCGNYRPGVGSSWGRNAYQSGTEGPHFALQRLAEAEAGLERHPGRRSLLASVDYWLSEALRPYENLTCDLKCPVCGRVTRHAVVRSSEIDATEEANQPPRDAFAQLEQMGIRIIEVDGLATGGSYVRGVGVALVQSGLPDDRRRDVGAALLRLAREGGAA